MNTYHPIFATRQPLRVGEMRKLLADAGIAEDPQLIHPDELEPAMHGADNCLVMIDGQWMPDQDVLIRLRSSSPRSRFVLWADRLSADLLLATMECELHGLLSSRLPAHEAASALARICRGERILRFDADSPEEAPVTSKRQLAAPQSFDAQWMLHGAEPSGKQT